MNWSFLNTRGFFLLILLIYIAFFSFTNREADIGSLSSDLMLYQMVMVQEEESPWEFIPPNYNREELYLAYPIFYFLNPGLEHSFLGYHAFMVVLIITTYTLSGYVIWRITRNWGFATLGALLILIPHNVGFTTIGLSNFGDLRGNALAYPFYLLLGYHWLIESIHDNRKNALMAILAGFLIYLYPIASLITVFTFSCAGLVVYGRKILKPLFQFAVIYTIVVAPFLFVHFTNPNAQMISSKDNLSGISEAQVSEILSERFSANAYLATLDIARIKRTIWDSAPLVIILFLGLFLYRRREVFTDLEWQAHKISLASLTVLVIFLVGIDALNTWRSNKGELPVFIEHIRAMRISGFILIMESVVVLSAAYKYLKRGAFVLIVSVALILLPIHFSAPAIRVVARSVVPESLRVKYNLAPIVYPGQKPLMKNIVDAGYWGRENLPEDSRVFVISMEQHDFIFKFISRRETNLTNKEGSLWVTAGSDTAVKWHENRALYTEIVSTYNPESIINLARSQGMTHILLFKGQWGSVFENYLDGVEYENPDYYIIKI